MRVERLRRVDLAGVGEREAGGVGARAGRQLLGRRVAVVLGAPLDLLAEELLDLGEVALGLLRFDLLVVTAVEAEVLGLRREHEAGERGGLQVGGGEEPGRHRRYRSGHLAHAFPYSKTKARPILTVTCSL